MSYENEIARILTLLGKYYGKQLDPDQIEMYVEDLIDLPPEPLARAVKLYRNNPKNAFFPLPSQLRAMVLPPETPEDSAREAAGRIVAAISTVGPYDHERAKNYIGQLGWEIVKRQGGWLQVCEAMTYQNQTSLQAQWRDLGATLYRRSESGRLGEAPALPGNQPKEIGELLPLSKLLEKLPHEPEESA